MHESLIIVHRAVPLIVTGSSYRSVYNWLLDFVLSTNFKVLNSFWVFDLKPESSCYFKRFQNVCDWAPSVVSFYNNSQRNALIWQLVGGPTLSLPLLQRSCSATSLSVHDCHIFCIIDCWWNNDPSRNGSLYKACFNVTGEIVKTHRRKTC